MARSLPYPLDGPTNQKVLEKSITMVMEKKGHKDIVWETQLVTYWQKDEYILRNTTFNSLSISFYYKEQTEIANKQALRSLKNWT